MIRARLEDLFYRSVHSNISIGRLPHSSALRTVSAVLSGGQTRRILRREVGLVRRKGWSGTLRAERSGEGPPLAPLTDIPAPIRVVLADDHPLVLASLEEFFSSEPDIAVVASCRTGDDALAALQAHTASVLVLDLRMPGMHGLEVLRAIRNAGLSTRVVIFTAMLDDDEMVDALWLGARGFVLKEMSPSFLLHCIRTVHAGGQWMERQFSLRAFARLLRCEIGMRQIAEVLGPMERGIVRAVARGVHNREIADRLHVSEDALRLHLHDIYDKLGVGSRAALMRYAQDNALI